MTYTVQWPEMNHNTELTLRTLNTRHVIKEKKTKQNAKIVKTRMMQKRIQIFQCWVCVKKKKKAAKYFKPEISSFNTEICTEAYWNVWAVEEGKQSALAAFSDLQTRFSWLALFNSPENKLLTSLQQQPFIIPNLNILFGSENKHNYNALWLPAQASKQPASKKKQQKKQDKVRWVCLRCIRAPSSGDSVQPNSFILFFIEYPPLVP